VVAKFELWVTVDVRDYIMAPFVRGLFFVRVSYVGLYPGILTADEIHDYTNCLYRVFELRLHCRAYIVQISVTRDWLHCLESVLLTERFCCSIKLHLQFAVLLDAFKMLRLRPDFASCTDYTYRSLTVRAFVCSPSAIRYSRFHCELYSLRLNRCCAM